VRDRSPRRVRLVLTHDPKGLFAAVVAEDGDAISELNRTFAWHGRDYLRARRASQ
jgi:hypothetical protein